MDEILTPQQQDLVDRYGDFYRSLISGKRKPETESQAHFIEAFHGRVAPTTDHEIAFTKFARIVQAKRETEARQRQADKALRDNRIEDAAGQRNYPTRVGDKFDEKWVD